jgi:hypothetical protein
MINENQSVIESLDVKLFLNGRVSNLFGEVGLQVLQLLMLEVLGAVL